MCKKNVGDLEITNVAQRPNLGILFTLSYTINAMQYKDQMGH